MTTEKLERFWVTAYRDGNGVLVIDTEHRNRPDAEAATAASVLDGAARPVYILEATHMQLPPETPRLPPLVALRTRVRKPKAAMELHAKPEGPIFDKAALVLVGPLELTTPKVDTRLPENLAGPIIPMPEPEPRRPRKARSSTPHGSWPPAAPASPVTIARAKNQAGCSGVEVRYECSACPDPFVYLGVSPETDTPAECLRGHKAGMAQEEPRGN